MRKKSVVLLLILMGFLAQPVWAAGSGSRLASGIQKIVIAPFYLPAGVLQGAVKSFPIGILPGTVIGTVKTVTTILSGVFDLVAGAAPLAKYAPFFFL